MRYLKFAAVLVGIACAVQAHQGVENPVVKTRMDLMDGMAVSTRALGMMAKGEAAFDANRANAALLQIEKAAADTPTLFQAPETDPLSEALPDIWTDFDEFARRSRALEDAARTAVPVATQSDLRTALANVGRSCSGCHEVYRMP